MKTTQFLTRSTRTLLQRSTPRSAYQTASVLRPSYSIPKATTTPQPFSTTRSIHKGLQPDTSNPSTPKTEPNTTTSYSSEPANIKDSEYHEIADQYMNTLLLVLEDKIESTPDYYDVEFAAGVLTLNTPNGTYVINKQPPNKQIWLSSPTSGPKRYDWVVASEGQDMKEGTEMEVGDDGHAGGGKWVYLRDGSTLTELLRDEVGVEVAMDQEADVTVGREGSGGSG